jgi:hypothetical protein
MVPKAKARVAHSEIRHAALRNFGLPVFEDIAHTSQRSYQRLLSIAIYLPTQAIDVNIHDIGVWMNPHAPDLVQNHRTSNYPTGIPTEILQEHKLLWGQLQQLAGARSFAAKQVQFKIENAEPSYFIPRRVLALEQVAQPRQQLCHCKRLS